MVRDMLLGSLVCDVLERERNLGCFNGPGKAMVPKRHGFIPERRWCWILGRGLVASKLPIK